MDLKNCIGILYSNKECLLKLWQGTFDVLIGHKICKIYKFSQDMGNENFQLPFIIDTGMGYITICSFSDKLSIGWNNIDPNLRDFTYNGCKISCEEYEELSHILGSEIINIKILESKSGIRGIEFITGNKLVLRADCDNGNMCVSVNRYSAEQITADKHLCPGKYCAFWNQVSCGQAFKAFGENYDCIRRNAGGLRDWYEPCERELTNDGIPSDYFKCK